MGKRTIGFEDSQTTHEPFGYGDGNGYGYGDSYVDSDDEGE